MKFFQTTRCSQFVKFLIEHFCFKISWYSATNVDHLFKALASGGIVQVRGPRTA